MGAAPMDDNLTKAELGEVITIVITPIGFDSRHSCRSRLRTRNSNAVWGLAGWRKPQMSVLGVSDWTDGIV